ncbi:MAG: prepilin-type N-terminal cleavage/methylation domain-containing protein [Chloroflexi bacterium]|nr:prepilin-type N-terminal cleavage/methylation domain-containing protein [Chloroflexota bacterium]
MKPGGFKRSEQGFTLIEIVVVLAVLATLAAIAIPSVTGYIGQGRVRAWEGDQRTLTLAVNGWRGDVKKHPGNPWPTIGAKSTSDNISGTIGDPVDGNSDGDFMDASDNNTFIDIKALADEGYLTSEDALKSALVNASKLGTTSTNNPSGSYAWYIDSKGRVQSWYPADDTLGTPGAVDIDESEKGFQTDIYP